jgi:pimeloyl-ACP methyl ester carboxylesterase
MKSTHSAKQQYTTDLVTSRDGTIIGYRQLGWGPGMILLHGGMSSAHNHLELAQALADAFSVYVPDRRGRCGSGPFGVDYCIRKEVEDLEALLAKTRANNVFGVSSGGLIVLEAARSSAMIRKAAIFEPALFLDRSIPAAVLKRLDGEMEAGNIAAALITGMKGAQMGPAILRALPRRLLEFLANIAMKAEGKDPKCDYVPVRALAATLHYDSELVVEMSGDVEPFRSVHAEVLLMGGSKSPAYLKVALDALEQVLPKVRRIEFRGLNHAASWNTDRGGTPKPVAHELRQFFSSNHESSATRKLAKNCSLKLAIESHFGA